MKQLTRRSAQGFTLIELMVALGLGVLLSFGLMQVLQNTRLLSNTETSLSRVQEVGRYAVEVLAADLRKTGFYGRSDPGNIDIQSLVDFVADPNTSSLLGYEVGTNGTFSPALPNNSVLKKIQTGTAAAGSVVARPNSDVLYIQYATTSAGLQTLEAKSELFCKNPSTAPNTLDVGLKAGETGSEANPICFDKDKPVVVSNGSRALIFKNTANKVCINDSTSQVTLGFAQADWQKICTTDQQVPAIGKGAGEVAGASVLFGESLVGGVTYFVADTGRNTPLGDDIYSLYRMVGGNAAEELVEGIEYMQVQYGEEMGTDKFRYTDASSMNESNFAKVKSVRIGLLVQGLDRSLTEADDRSYRLLNVTIPATGDGAHAGGFYLRKPFVTTVKLRNRSIDS